MANDHQIDLHIENDLEVGDNSDEQDSVSDTDENENNEIDQLLQTANELHDEKDEKKRSDLGATFKFGQASRTIFA